MANRHKHKHAVNQSCITVSKSNVKTRELCAKVFSKSTQRSDKNVFTTLLLSYLLVTWNTLVCSDKRFNPLKCATTWKSTNG